MILLYDSSVAPWLIKLLLFCNMKALKATLLEYIPIANSISAVALFLFGGHFVMYLLPINI